MIKKSLIIIGLLIVSLFLVSCASEEVSEEEINQDFEELSDQDFVEVVADDDSALAGQATRRISSEASRVKKKIERVKVSWTCEQNSERVVMTSSLGYKRELATHHCVGDKLYSFFCNSDDLKWKTPIKVCENGCEDKKCVADEPTEPENNSAISLGAGGGGTSSWCDSIEVELIGEETLADANVLIDEAELTIIFAPGEFENSKGTFLYRQNLNFDNNSKSVTYVENDDDEPDNHFLVESGDYVATYNLIFDDDVQSDIMNSVYDDLEDQVITLFADEYTITKAVKLVDDNSIELTFTGPNEIVISDNDYTDSVGESGSMRIDGETVESNTVIIEGKIDGGAFNLASIKVEIVAQDNYYVGVGDTLTEAINDQGEQTESLISDNWNIRFNSYDSDSGTSVLEIGKLCSLE